MQSGDIITRGVVTLALVLMHLDLQFIFAIEQFSTEDFATRFAAVESPAIQKNNSWNEAPKVELRFGFIGCSSLRSSVSGNMQFSNAIINQTLCNAALNA